MPRYELRERTVLDVYDTETDSALTTFTDDDREAAQKTVAELEAGLTISEERREE
jgi:hypothetical protein